MQRARMGWADIHDRFLAYDPGLIRMLSALSTVCAAGLTLGILAALDASVPTLVAGALTAMVTTVAVTEPRPRDQALTLATGVPDALSVMAVGSALAPYRVAADVVFVLLIFAALYIRRSGPRATTLGIFAFQLFFVTQFIDARVKQLPQLFLAVLVAFGSSALIRFAVLRSTPGRTLDRLLRAFGLRLVLVLDALIEVAEQGPQAKRAERAADDLRRRTAHLHAGALMIQNRLGSGTPDERTATALQRRVAEAETAVERLAVLVLRALWPGADVDTLTRHLTTVRPAGSVTDDVLDAATLPVLISELRALRGAVRPDPLRPTGDDHAETPDRLLGYRGEQQLPDASPAMQDVFRSAGDLARALSGLHLSVYGETSAGQAAPEAVRPHKKLTAQDSGPAAKDPVPKQRGPRIRPTTRTALQVATGSALAVVGGELLSPQRWYWAVFTCWVVFISTSSTGEILVRGYRRLIGTVAGVVAGLVLAALIGDTPWPAFALAGLSVFGMYYTIAVSYTLMSFFVTTMIGMLYTLLHTLTLEVLVVRIAETAMGIACGLAAALLVLPVHTQDRTQELLRDVLERLRAVLSPSLAQLGGESGGDLLDPARALDAALDSLRLSVQPLISPISPLRSRRRTALGVLGLLETAAFHTRSLAATAELVPAGLHIGTDERLVNEVRRIDRNLETLIDRIAVKGRHDTTLVRGPGIPAQLKVNEGGARTEDINAARRVLRHLQRVDESIQGLARTLQLPVRDDS
ncbi:FUSC family protein [[Kitasatospora] papulosa]|uniref:FUSC family protein n=1 Tax=[Kitasatospora] papulosa TaxID=1464011 RepID=UPI0036A134C7